MGKHEVDELRRQVEVIAEQLSVSNRRDASPTQLKSIELIHRLALALQMAWMKTGLLKLHDTKLEGSANSVEFDGRANPETNDKMQFDRDNWNLCSVQSSVWGMPDLTAVCM